MGNLLPKKAGSQTVPESGLMCQQKCEPKHKLDQLLFKEGDLMESSLEKEFSNEIFPQSIQCQPDQYYIAPKDFDKYDPARAYFLTMDLQQNQICMGKVYDNYKYIGNLETYLKVRSYYYNINEDKLARIRKLPDCCEVMEYFPYIISLRAYTGLDVTDILHGKTMAPFIAFWDDISKLKSYLSPAEMAAFVMNGDFTLNIEFFSKNIEGIIKLKEIFQELGMECGVWTHFMGMLPSEIFLTENQEQFFDFVRRYGKIATEFNRDHFLSDRVNVNQYGSINQFLLELSKFSDRPSGMLLNQRFYNILPKDILQKNAKALLEILVYIIPKVKTKEDFKLFSNVIEPLIALAKVSPNFVKLTGVLKEFEYIEKEGPKIDIFFPPLYSKKEYEYFLDIVSAISTGVAKNPDLLEKDFDLFLQVVDHMKKKILRMWSKEKPFYRPFTTPEEYGQELRVHVNPQQIEHIISTIPINILETDLDLILYVLSNVPSLEVGEIFESIKKVKSLYQLKKVLSDISYDLRVGKKIYELKEKFRFFDYMVSIGMDNGQIYDFLVSEPYIRVDERQSDFNEEAFLPLLKDYRDGKDLSIFDPDKRDLYRDLFFATFMWGFGNKVGEWLLEKIDVSNIAVGKDILDLYDIAIDIDNTINSALAKRIYDLAESELSKPYALMGLLSRFYDPSRRKIDVTQNNMREINNLIKTLIKFKDAGRKASDINIEIAQLFPDYVPQNSVEEILAWTAYKFDVEEIDFSKIKGVDLFSEYVDLMSGLDELKNLSATKYLGNKMLEMAEDTLLAGSSDKSALYINNISAIESLRAKINTRNKILGDQLIDALGSGFLISHKASLENLPLLLKFAKAWDIGESFIDKDVRGLYLQFSKYAFDVIAGYLSDLIARHEGSLSSVKNYIGKSGIDFDLDAVMGELSIRGFSIEREGKFSKGLKRIVTNPVYVARRLSENDSPVEINTYNFAILDSSWAERDGVTIKEIWENGRELAKAFKFKPRLIGVNVAANKSGLVDTKGEIAYLGSKYIFSAPMTMTTGIHKMTELVFKNGEQISYLWTQNAKDGILLVDPNGVPKIIDKRSIQLSELIDMTDLEENKAIRAEVFKWARIRGPLIEPGMSFLTQKLTPSDVFWDKHLLLKLVALKKYSLLSNILVINGDEVHSISDGNTDRRFFVEYDDGTFGILDSTENMSTGDLAKIARAMGVKKAIYMDTGMYDYATFCDGKNECHIIGHKDTFESTNRVFIYQK